jgi:spore maturation protein CgeB
MKILISGYHNPHFETITEYIERAVQTLGHELIIFDDRKHIIPGRLRYRVPWLQHFDLQHINRKFTRLAIATRPDVAVVTGGHRISTRAIDTIKKNKIVAILWTIDPPTNFQPILDAAPHYDFIFCQGTEAIEYFEKKGITGAHWLPMACDPSIHHPVDVVDNDRKLYSHDVVFAGSWYQSREDLFSHLADFDLAIWGPGWNAMDTSSPLKKHLMGLHLEPSEWRKIYSTAKIVLAPHYNDPKNNINVYQASPRIFEALACGTFVISDDQRDVFSLFEDGKHLIRFSDAEDLRQKIRYFLDRPIERQTIAQRGKDEVLRRHTYQDRIRTLLSIIQQ